MKHPSKESLLREFPEAKQERIRELSQIFEAQSPREEAEQFLHDHRLGTSPRSTEKLILRVADWALRGEGVCEIHYGERTPYPLAIYVDMGGLSRKTILYDVKNEEFVLTKSERGSPRIDSWEYVSILSFVMKHMTKDITGQPR